MSKRVCKGGCNNPIPENLLAIVPNAEVCIDCQPDRMCKGECGKLIPKMRLAAMPSAERCVACEATHEKASRDKKEASGPRYRGTRLHRQFERIKL